MSAKDLQPPKVQKRLATKVARSVILVALVIGLMMSTIVAYLDLQETNDSFRKTVEQVIKTAHEPAARSAYNVNDELAGEVANGLMEYDSLISVTILDDLHNTLTSRSRVLETSPHRWIADEGFGGLQSFEIELRTIDDPEVKAGYLQVIADPIGVAEEFVQRVTLEALVIILQSLIIAGIFSLIFYRLLIGPLQNISHALATTDPDNPLQSQLNVPKTNQGDELYVLAESGNRLLQSIAKRTQERDTAEADLRKAAQTLEQRIVDRTVELAKQFEAAKAASKAKQEFLASMSHEIRTPMAGVLGLADMLLDDDITPDTREKVEKMKETTQSLLVIINDILDLSKIDSGKLKLENIDYRLRHELYKAIEVVEQSAQQKSLKLNIQIDDDIPNNLHGDPNRLRQVLINLLGNAIKFTEKGHVTLSAQQTVHENDNRFLIISVTDTGIGIPKDRLKDIFDEFTQADASISRRYAGTGLGLAISKRLVDILDGSISVSSEENKGTVFTVKLPLKKSDDTAAPPAEKKVAALYEAQRSLSILAVDDNPLNLRIVSVLMAKYGHVVRQADTGKKAIDILSDPALAPVPDLILMDIRMPEMSGPEATEIIRGFDNNIANVPIIALTADVVEEHVKEFMDAGMNGFVAKPINPGVLLEEINNVMLEKIHEPVVEKEQSA
ncbi:ATP-binding protein [Kiloniella litopenaei]|uniref:ATP-binding protein n=1 Tax=Kiloniella litopenaei TaxID=1549748 RepID=UPI0006987464|nr:ATP-binding protein [Kiloniella litopenaei]